MQIDFQNDLNPAQYQAATHGDGPVLVIAGAGSGKTRTIVYRLARLIEQGVPQESILLLTFTRKAAKEMVDRAGELLQTGLHGTFGGTFHAFAFSVLRRYAHELGLNSGVTIMDQADSQGLVKQAREELKLGKGDRSFPKKSTILGLISKCRNKETELARLIQDEAFHLAHYAEDIESVGRAYRDLKKRYGYLDYDDLLFRLEELFMEHPEILAGYHRRFSHVLVDEYQDTNLVQARLVKLLAGERGNVMAVGDDAQSIYAFRGATVNNIMDFPKVFPGTEIIRLERNYRSTQPVLDLSNHVLDNAAARYEKNLFSDKEGPLPRIVHPLSDRSQAERVADLIMEYRRDMPLNEIAVLFRAGYQSFSLEVELKKIGLPYRKYGGMKFYEAAHIKDVLSLLKVIRHPGDTIAWRRAMEHIKGVGPKTCDRIVGHMLAGRTDKLAAETKKKPEVGELLSFLDSLRRAEASPRTLLEQVTAFFDPVLRVKYADDYPRRQHGIEELLQVSAKYADLETFLGDTALDPKEEEQGGDDRALTLSTVHSAKGLEWEAVIILDMVEDRFPSKRAMTRPEDLEEERRLLYVACTRAKRQLALFVPSTIHNRYTQMSEPAIPSPFVGELPRSCYESWQEGYTGTLSRREGTGRAPAWTPRDESLCAVRAVEEAEPEERPASGDAAKTTGYTGFCRHKIFGRGKIIDRIPPNKCRVNFPGFGPKIILEEYLEMVP